MDVSTASEPSLPSLPELGDVVGGRFEILAMLGEGGMGTVYRARDRVRGEVVALKLLAPRYLGRPEREARVFREAELTERAGRHPSLVEVLEAGRLAPHGWPYLVMRVVEGESLWARVAFGGALPPAVAVRLARQVAGAVAALHRAGVVHRDVTPMNVLVEGHHAVLIDLSHAGDHGAPQAAVGRTGRLTGPHEVPGTHYYMSREQACAEPAHPTMDVFAFGVTLVHTLTGVAPTELPREAFLVMAQRGMVEAPTVDVRVYPEVPHELAELCDECTRTDPAARPSMDEVVARLDGMLVALQPLRRAARKVYPVGGIAEGARREGGGSSEEIETAAEAGRTGAAAVETATQARTKPRWWIAMAAGLLILAVAGPWWLRSWRPPAPTEERSTEGLAERERALASSSSEASHGEPTLPSEPRINGPDGGPPDAGASAADVPAKADPAMQPRPAPPRNPPRAKDTEACREARRAAQAAKHGYDWDAVLIHTERRACWSGEERKRLRVLALLELGRFEACVREGGRSTDPAIVTLVEKCEEAT